MSNDRIQFTFNAHNRINDDEVLSESAFTKLVMLARASKGSIRRLLIADGKISLVSDGRQIELPENIKLQIIMLTIEVNNVLMLGKHTMNGNRVYELEPDAVAVLSYYLSYIFKVICF